MSTADSGNNFLKEWEASREVIRLFDDRLHDLRKYGFSFITAFLTATTILFEKWIVEPSAGFQGEVFPEPIKATILGVTLLLIFVLYILDRNYLVLQRAAATRASILEKILNIELSDVITQRHRKNGVRYLMTSVYLFFILAVCLLGNAVLPTTSTYLYAFAIGLAIIVVVLSFDFVVMRYRYGMIDWMLDKLECKQGDEVRIIMTNLTNGDFPKKGCPISSTEKMWKLVKEDDSKHTVLKFGTALEGLEIGPAQNYMWILDTTLSKDEKKYLDPGIYCVYRRIFNNECQLLPEDKMIPLSRKLRIISKPKDSSVKPAIEVTLKHASQESKTDTL
jgi:hypothetical protein